MTPDKDAKFQLDASTLALVGRLLREHVRPHYWRIAAALALMTVVAAATTGQAYLVEPVLDDVLGKGDRAILILIAAAVLTSFVGKGVATFGQSVIMNWVGFRIIADFQVRMFAHLMRADLVFFHDNAAGSLVSRFINDVQVLRKAASDSLTGIGKDSLTLIFLTGLMFRQDWALASIAFVAFPTAALPIIKIGRRMRRVSTATQFEVGQYSALLDEAFQGARHVKAYGMEAYETGRATDAVNRVFRLYMKAIMTRSLSHPIMETLGGVAVTGIILYGGWQVMNDQKTAGNLMSFIAALFLAYEPLKRLANLNASLQEGLAAAQRVFTMLDIEPEIRDRPGARPLEVRGGEIRFEGVHFAYAPDVPALRGIDLVVPAGRTVALVGSSGAGKSTVLNLIPRFYDVGRGRVTIDGTDLRDVTLASLRAAIGLVSQENSLFDDTVRANIAYGKPGATQAEIEAAARLAGAHDFIEGFTKGYDTRVGGRGVKISGGQAQRLAIARAMLKGAPILLLDEATSALDANTERQVQAALKTLMRGRTTLIVAHRLSSVVDADIIYVMERGQVIESGRHGALLARDGAYARLYARQVADEAPAAE